MMSIVGQNIRKLRERLGETQTAFGERFGLSRGKIASYEAELSPSEPALATIIEIVDFFDIDLRTFITDTAYDGSQGNGTIRGKAKTADKTNGIKNDVPLNVPLNVPLIPPHKTNGIKKEGQTPQAEIIVATQDTSGNPTYTVINHKAAANYLAGYQSQEYIEHQGAVSLPRAIVGSSRQGIFLQIAGNSMTPKFHDGDWVACTLLDRSEWPQIRDYECYVVVSTTYGIQFKRLKNRLADGFIRCQSDNRHHRPYDIHQDDLLQLFRFVLHISPDDSNPDDTLNKKVDYLEDTTTDLRTLLEQMQERLDSLEQLPGRKKTQ